MTKMILTFLLFFFSIALPFEVFSATIQYIIHSPLAGEALQNVQAKLADAAKALDDNPSASELSFFAHNHLTKTVEAALEPFGYFQNQTTVDNIQAKQPLQITVTITPGPVVKIHDIQLVIQGEGQNTRAFNHYIEKFPLKIGDPLNTQKYEQAKTRLFDMAANLGYFKAKLINSQVTVNLANHQAIILLQFFTGPRYHFGDTDFQGSPFKPNFLKRYMTYQAGDPYSLQRLQSLQTALGNSGYFKSVIVKPRMDQVHHQIVPVTVETHPLHSQQYTLGIGAGTDTGIRGFAALHFNHLGSSGQHADLIARASQIAQSLSVNYYIPGTKPTKSQYVISAIAENFNQALGQGQQYKLSGRYDTKIWGWDQSIALNFLRENYILENNPPEDNFITYPSINWHRIFADNPFHPNKGVSLNLNFSGAVDGALSDKSFFRAIADLRGLYTIGDNWRVVTHDEIGTLATHNLNTLPYSLQFYLGGSYSLRGYSYNDIGPGHNLIDGSLALQRRIKGNWYGEAFYDIGNVSDRVFGKLKQGAGPGILWQSPVGAFELTLAQVLPRGGKRVQFSFGTDL